ncbi:hypothetical protein NC653_023947 [Populus alba x Populus x berolinensis]|uniref:Uncharacterized protein n=1 Tax=Populus alba x Populus x berolinensis TaxID=444605 RepID=A0AAD6MIW7_9ROSI|nr:hypothetical protein NC653_023947 [Populus alba x Populus x berolinensis]
MKRFRCFRWRVAGLQQLQDDNDIKCKSAGVQGSRIKAQQDMKKCSNKLMRYSCGCNLCSKTQPIPSRDPLERGPPYSPRKSVPINELESHMQCNEELLPLHKKETICQGTIAGDALQHSVAQTHETKAYAVPTSQTSLF